jgi:serpin B
MHMPRMLPWVALTLSSGCVAACQGSPTAGARSQKVPPVTTASPAATTTIESEVLPATGSAGSPGPLETPSANEVAGDILDANGFTFRILGRATKSTENAMISGTSMRQALGAAYLGARGATAREMASALGLERDVKKAASLARAETAAWQDARGDAELNVANRLWIDDDFTLRPDYVKLADAAFGAAPASIDYKAPDEARKTINRWVAEKTKDKIPELLPQGSIDRQTRLVVTNAIWFKGRWENPFPKTATKDEVFKTSAKSSVTTPMMHMTESMRFAAPPGSGVRLLEMRYAESQLAMLVVLPDDTRGLAKLESNLSPDGFTTWTGVLSKTRVNVTLPKFEFRSGGPMGTPLQDLGMKLAFTSKADFRGIAELPRGEPLSISQVFHQTWVAVDELGTEAAAATGGTMTTTSMDLGPIVDFRADHPFLFFIYEPEHGRVLFAGRVVDPKP